MSEDKKQLPGILTKIVKAIREDAKILSEAVIDSGGSRGFEKKITKAKEHLQQAKHEISKEMAQELQSSRKFRTISLNIKEKEKYIADAIAQKDEEAALKLADEMIDLEQDKEAESAILHSHQLHLRHLNRQLEDAERTLKDLERQFGIVKTTERIQHATDIITKNFDTADSKMLSAKRSLERIRKKQKILDEKYKTDNKWLAKSPDSLSFSEDVTDQRRLDAKKLINKIKDKE